MKWRLFQPALSAEVGKVTPAKVIRLMYINFDFSLEVLNI